jgi:hypothetical protein
MEIEDPGRPAHSHSQRSEISADSSYNPLFCLTCWSNLIGESTNTASKRWWVYRS